MKLLTNIVSGIVGVLPDSMLIIGGYKLRKRTITAIVIVLTLIVNQVIYSSFIDDCRAEFADSQIAVPTPEELVSCADRKHHSVLKSVGSMLTLLE